MKPNDPDAPIGPFANESLDTVIDLALKRDKAERSHYASRVRVHRFLIAAGMILGAAGLYHEGYLGGEPPLSKKPSPFSLPVVLGAILVAGSTAQLIVDRRDKKRGTMSPGQDALDWDEELYELTEKAPNFDEPQFKYPETPVNVRLKRQKRVLELV